MFSIHLSYDNHTTKECQDIFESDMKSLCFELRIDDGRMESSEFRKPH
jgi:hypothetical protein